ncbi:hypothetical protein [Amycolatopsis granulosa]|nr:hypothetical protein [Amycolatopsis granulosa]NIH84045.1 Zn/Cd-binding protein ZinT [Amycolatopsis granulosa]
MKYQVARRIRSGQETVRAVLTEVENWPSWTASTTSVRSREPGPLR